MDYKSFDDVLSFLKANNYQFEYEPLGTGYVITIRTRAISRKILDDIMHLVNNGLGFLNILAKGDMIYITLYFKGGQNG